MTPGERAERPAGGGEWVRGRGERQLLWVGEEGVRRSNLRDNGLGVYVTFSGWIIQSGME